MAFCSFGDGAAMFDATPIENLFLMEYMYDAPDSALKTYLYARMLALHPELGGSLADMAKALRLSEDEVFDAFSYWERRGLVRRVSDNPPAWAFQSMRAPSVSPNSILEREMYANRDFNNSLVKLFGNQFIDSHEIRKAAEWQDTLKFDRDAILRILEYGIQTSRAMKGKTPAMPTPSSVFNRMDKLVKKWADEGIHTLEDVERAIAEETGEAAIAREALKKLGIYREPSQPELELVRRWTREWGYDQAAILAACDKTTNAQKPTLKYLDSILENQRDGANRNYEAVTAVLKELNPRSPQPTPDQLAQYGALIEKGYAPEMILLAAVQCHRLNKEKFDDLEWRLKVWRDDGVSTPEEADAYMRQMATLSRELREVFQRAGFDDRRPGYGAIVKYRGWRDAYPEDLIRFAAECSRNAGGSMAYMDRLLVQWQRDGVTTVEQARTQHEAWRQSAKSGEKAPNPALDYAQREYRDEDFGDDFLVDLDKYGEEDAQ